MSDQDLSSPSKSRSPWADPAAIANAAPHLAVLRALRSGSVLAWGLVGMMVVAVLIWRLFFFSLAKTVQDERNLKSQLPTDFVLPAQGGIAMELLLGIEADGSVTFNLDPVTDLRASLKQAAKDNQGLPIRVSISQSPEADPKVAEKRSIEILNAIAMELPKGVHVTLNVE